MKVTAILSMLHEPDAAAHSATRVFRGRPVLAWTLSRLRRSPLIENFVVLCWEDQLPAVRPIADEAEAFVLAKGPRVEVTMMQAVTAARRWADGWRGGLMSTCEFDRGFHGPWALEIAQNVPCDGVLLVDPAAGLVDPDLTDAILLRASEQPDSPLIFSQAAPGLAGAFVRTSLLEQLASLQTHPGRFLHYVPDQPCRDPITEPHCVPVPTPVARTTHRFTLDTDRQLRRVTRAARSLNGELPDAGAETLVGLMNGVDAVDPLPREVLVELNTRRATRPVFMPATYHAVERPEMSVDAAAALFTELAEADDMRVTLGGVGDPLLASKFFEVVDAARRTGIATLHVRTDLLGITPAALDSLTVAPIDVLSIHIPALSAKTYLAIMGVDGCAAVLENVRVLVERRWARGKATPILVPVFTKCRQNLAEMELWYDKWLRALGSAVIAGPSDYAGQIHDHAVADMAPPQRRPCARLASRLVVLSDGSIVACEQDFAGRAALGHIGADRISDIWTDRIGSLRAVHRCGAWEQNPLCAACREWHRP